uniref:POLO box domain-containing protein n=2 Tax=Clastoptera arizonana TaxID=38151 RepID=A0A1B6CAL4_9HEMI
MNSIFTGKENVNINSPPLSMPSFDVSSTMFGSKQNRSGSSIHSKSHSKLKTIHVPNIGIATQGTNGEISITYPDGTQLSFDGKSGGIAYHNGRNMVRYQQSDSDLIPDVVRDRLAQIPVVLRYFIAGDDSKHKPRSLR